MTALELKPLVAPVPAVFESMTFPAYRHLLALEPASRHPEQGDPRTVQPLALAAFREGVAAGLALAELPLGSDGGPEMLSLFTAPAERNRGVASALVERLELAVRDRGFSELTAVYMTGKPAIAAVERVLQKRGWSAPVTRTVTLRFTPEEALATPWFGRLRLSESEYEIFPWTELRPEERADLERTQAAAEWIPRGLEPWQHDRHGFDPVSSVGLRFGGRVVGWVINHRISPDSVRFTCSFMRKDLGRRGRILPLYTAALERLRENGCRMCTFVTPLGYPKMVEFVKRRCAPWASFFGETRGSTKALA